MPFEKMDIIGDWFIDMTVIWADWPFMSNYITGILIV
jgi:hypothetical protein